MYARARTSKLIDFEARERNGSRSIATFNNDSEN